MGSDEITEATEAQPPEERQREIFYVREDVKIDSDGPNTPSNIIPAGTPVERIQKEVPSGIKGKDGQESLASEYLVLAPVREYHNTKLKVVADSPADRNLRGASPDLE